MTKVGKLEERFAGLPQDIQLHLIAITDVRDVIAIVSVAIARRGEAAEATVPLTDKAALDVAFSEHDALSGAPWIQDATRELFEQAGGSLDKLLNQAIEVSSGAISWVMESMRAAVHAGCKCDNGGTCHVRPVIAASIDEGEVKDALGKLAERLNKAVKAREPEYPPLPTLPAPLIRLKPVRKGGKPQ